ncbi:amidase family protein [Serratia fonticola]|uniref:Amidase domain-containing protein n=1 Tax=Serratia fonticola TaxID=47917 RepID=A0AAW3WPH6_SERFO|nr:amidase family protein [Serratia fonticola]MBC3212437.1 hypothetical protein [Serratia fonticola]NYA12975.1 hypothetical protein [Serratia fonticola]NYA32553.1 hypothetical protein [Serratia fonticola]
MNPARINPSLIETIDYIRLGSVTPLDILEFCYDNYINKKIFNVLISEEYQYYIDHLKKTGNSYVRKYSNNVLYGIPIIVKDNIHVKRFFNTAGTSALSNFRPDADAWIVDKLKSHGAIIVGKANMHELSLGATSHNYAFGHVRNAHDFSLIAGGSSGGSAVAVALGLSPIAIGTDTAGSIRIPAALNGIIGFRPSLNRYSSKGITPVTPSRDVPGVLATCVADVRLLDELIFDDPDTICNEPDSSSRTRIGIVRDFFYVGVDDKILDIIEEKISLLKENGFEIIELEFPELSTYNDIVSTVIGLYEFWPAMEHYLREYAPQIDMNVLVESVASKQIKELISGFMSPNSLYGIDKSLYEETKTHKRPKLVNAFAEFFIKHKISAIALPTTVSLANNINDGENISQINGETVSSNYAYLRNTLPASNAGLPAITIPAGKTKDNNCVGFELNGPIGSDKILLSIAEDIENIFHLKCSQ